MKKNMTKKYKFFTEREQLQALVKNQSNIALCYNPSERIQLEAAKRWDYALCYIDNPPKL